MKSGWHVLIVDDSPDDRDEIQRLLLRGSERRYFFTEAATGAAGIEAVRGAALMPDCIVLDFNLHDMDALEVLASIAAPDGSPVCPIVVLTGGTGSKAGRLVLRAGAQDYISKGGLTPPVLTRVLENSVERFAMAQDALHQNAAQARDEKTLSAAHRRRDAFTALVAQALRNPLASVSTDLQMLRLASDARASPQEITILERRLGHVQHLIDALLDVSRFADGKILLRVQGTPVSAVVEQVVKAARPMIAARRHTFNVELPPEPLQVELEASKLARIIEVLANNSARYSTDGSDITLSARQDGGEVVLRVADTGLHIAGNVHGQIFGGVALVARTFEPERDALAVGLRLMRQLIEMHGGTLVIENTATGNGSVFTNRLPVAMVTVDCKRDMAADLPVAARGRRILIVDDHVDGAMMLATLLGLSGHATRTVFAGEDAAAAAMQFDAEVIFLDIGLPGLDGHDVARQIRATPALRDTVLIALTGRGGPDALRQSREAGFDHHLTKPAEFAAIAALLAGLEVAGVGP